MNMQMSGIWICSAYVIFSLSPVQIRFLVKSEPTISEYLISQFLYPFAFIIFFGFSEVIMPVKSTMLEDQHEKTIPN